MTKLSKTAKNDQPRQTRSRGTLKGATPRQAEHGDDASSGAATNNQPPPAPNAAAPKQPSKQDRLAGLLVRDEGATLEAMVEATGWLKHTVRAALTGLKKKGYALSSDKVDGVRTYRAASPE